MEREPPNIFGSLKKRDVMQQQRQSNGFSSYLVFDVQPKFYSSTGWLADCLGKLNVFGR